MMISPTGQLLPSQEAALADLAIQRPLIALDFDGTIAPIVADPGQAHVPRETASLLAALAERCHVAIVTGRRIEDARPRLGFSPWRIVGNHGAENSQAPALAAALARSLLGFRSRLQRASRALSVAGVTIEDKQQSISFHYRLAADRERATSAIHAFLADSHDDVHVFGGKCVVNVAPAKAPDKADAVHSLLAESGARTVFYAGDDVNDEPVFRTAPPHWVTVRVGSDPKTRARMVVDGPPALAGLLHNLLERLA